MKKIMSTVSISLSSAILLSMAAPMTVLAVDEEVTQKDVTAYLYSMENTEMLKCLFKSTMPDMPYISTVDFCTNIFKGEVTEVKNSDGTYTVSNQSGSMVINTENDTLYFDVFENFINSEADIEGTILDSPYAQPIDVTIEGELKDLTLDLGDYDIDILEVDGRTYMPLSSIGLLFSQTYNTAEYANGSVYFIHSSDYVMTGELYFDRTNIYEDDHRSQEMIDLTYNELCFAVDKLYGRPAKAEIAASVEEKGFDRTLDEYSDETRRAKELMMSDSKTDFIYGISYLVSVFYDGGHTVFDVPLGDAFSFPQTAVGTSLAERINDMSNADTMSIIYASMKSYYDQQGMISLSEQREEDCKAYETVNMWDDISHSKLLLSGDTAVFVFDSFVNEAVDHFKWSLDYAKENGVKRFVIDLSCNTGGNTVVAMYMIAMMCNKDNNNSSASMSTIQTLTGNIFSQKYALDLNLDGEVNNLDNDVYYDFEYAILTSRFSFSSANLLPSLAKDNGIAIIGETSGGGACGVDVIFTAEAMPYTLSGYTKFINKDNKDVDSGALPDYDLTKQITDEDGEIAVDYSGMYDVASYNQIIDNFYGVTEKPSEESSEESSEEVSKESSDKAVDESSENPSNESSGETPEETSEESSNESSSENVNESSENISEESSKGSLDKTIGKSSENLLEESSKEPSTKVINNSTQTTGGYFANNVSTEKTSNTASGYSNNNSIATGDNDGVQFVILVMFIASATILAFRFKKEKSPKNISNK